MPMPKQANLLKILIQETSSTFCTQPTWHKAEIDSAPRSISV